MQFWQDATLVAATVTVGLVAGLFAAFSYAVMPGLRQVDDATFTATMRAVNRAILNPLFLTLFTGALLLSGAAAGLQLSGGEALVWTVVGFAGYLATFVVTAAGNVPLNTALEAGGTREAFEARWSRLNTVRALTNTVSLVSLAVALTRG